MGIYDREYYRGSTRGSSLISGAAPVCKGLIAVNVLVFIGQVLTNNQPMGVTGWLALEPQHVIEKWQIWRIVTAAFCHDPNSLFHLLFNMLFLWWFGQVLESTHGSREFLTFYLTAVCVASLGFLGLALYTDRAAFMIGASGAVYAIVMLYALYYPHQKILLFFVIPVEIRWFAIGIVVFSAWPVLQSLAGNEVAGNTAHVAHLGGLVYGFLYKRYNLRFGSLFANRRLPRWDRLFGSRSKLRVYREPQDSSMDQRVDEILEKISRHGEASLSDEERNTLIKASRRYQDRNS